MQSGSERLRIEDAIINALTLGAGYSVDAVFRDYAFADYFDPRQIVRRVSVAAFSEQPPTYRSACLAIAFRQDDDEPAPSEVSHFKSLGAPRLVFVGPGRATVWSLARPDDPQKTQELRARELPDVIVTNAAAWSPRAILRAKNPVRTTYQLHIADFGLLPLIEQQVNERLDYLIRDVIHQCVSLDAWYSEKAGFTHLASALIAMLTAKVLIDREHDVPAPASPHEALAIAERHVGGRSTPPNRPTWPRLLDLAWALVSESFRFHNIPVDTLAFIYENTLVTHSARAELGVHGTPLSVARFALDHLPLDELPESRPVAVELCSGYAPFLLAAIQQLSANASSDSAVRHAQLVARLRGVEIDRFALEVSRLCLTLADYPNKNGWDLRHGDIFEPGVVAHALADAGAVFANPPYGRFTSSEMSRWDSKLYEKQGELLRRILLVAPPFLCYLAPRSLFESGKAAYRVLYRDLLARYEAIQTIALPDVAFQWSDVDTILLLGRRREDTSTTSVRLSSARLSRAGWPAFQTGDWTPEWSHEVVESESLPPPRLWADGLGIVWEELKKAPTLKEVADVHRGIEYRFAIKNREKDVFTSVPGPNFSLGVEGSENLDLYRSPRPIHLWTDPRDLKKAGTLPWETPKILLNAGRRSRGPWCLSASLDLSGLWCYQTILAVWSRLPEWPLQLIAAVLNGPVANAWVHGREAKRHVRVGTVRSIPLPAIRRLDVPRITGLVDLAAQDPTHDLLLKIDAEILKGYQLGVKAERRLLRLFDGLERPGGVTFPGYYPLDFRSAIPLHQLLASIERSKNGPSLSELPVYDDERVSQMFRAMTGDDE